MDPRVPEFMEVDERLARLVYQKKLPGLAISFLRNGLSLWNRGYGYASLENESVVEPSKTVFRAASASKPIAATALANMVENGIIDLDASFYDYVAYFPKKKYDFTIRQLASHTAGIRGYRGKEFALNRPYSIKDSLVIFQDDPLMFKPGTSYLYNSYDWVLLSLAMQEASGSPFEDYVYEHVLQPLGMEDTKPENPARHTDNKAEFYTRTQSGFRKALKVDNRYKLAGGGYLSTVADLMTLGRSYLENRILSPAMSKEFLSPVLINERSTYYGLGWEVSSDGSGRSYYGHTGSSVGAYSNFYIYPEQKAVVVILINCTDPKLQPELNHCIDLLFKSEYLA